MSIAIMSLQFVVFFRSKFLDYKKYANDLNELFESKESSITENPYFVGLPDDYPLFSIATGTGISVNISVQNTSFVYAPSNPNADYDAEINKFSEILVKYVTKFIGKNELCTRVGYVNNSIFEFDNPDAIVRESFFKEPFYSDATELFISFNQKEMFFDFQINKLTRIQSQEIEKKEIETNSFKKVSALIVTHDINTHGLHENLPSEFIIKLIEFSNAKFASEKVEGSIYGN